MYFAVKHVHMLTVVISVSLFLFRYLLMMRDSQLLSRRWLKVLPHVNDTLLLGSAVWLCMMLHQYPLAQAWLTEKVVLVIAYILLGFVTLKLGPNKWVRSGAFIAAMGIIVYVAKLAHFKQPMLLG